MKSASTSLISLFILGFASLSAAQQNPRITITDSVSVTTDINQTDVLSPDPSEKVFVRQDLLDANPGRPGSPISIPGYPTETSASGIKAPQYFAPGVAGDHGEPIAQFIAVGSYLVPNNLSANAHGNGYADPNLFIPEVLSSVQVDGGAFNVREGNHAVNLAATYALRSRLDPFLTMTGDYRDFDLTAGLSPGRQTFVALEASVGNGFLRRLEHRQQYKVNAQRITTIGHHELTILGIAYYGVSYIPGLVPLFTPNLSDTIDPRQREQTHNALAAVNDVWTLTSRQQLQISGFFRTENLSLFSNFGSGLIRQSEFRTVAGQSTNYIGKVSEAFSLLAGLDYSREAPRRDNLDHYNEYAGTPETGNFSKIDSSNLTLTAWAPYVAGAGQLSPYLRYYAGWRRDEVELVNDDLIKPANSSDRRVGVNSPKLTVSFLPRSSWFVPLVSVSFGQAFFTADPRIALGPTNGTPIATAHSYQLVASKAFGRTDVRITLGHVTKSLELARIDPDTGLQQDQGPSRMRFLTAAVRRDFDRGSLLLTFSKADARDLDSGLPTPEAPRTIFDVTGNTQRLPLGMAGKAEFEYVGSKPLGIGCAPDPNAECTGTSVRELRLSLTRSFDHEHLAAGINSLIASGYTGQTTEPIGTNPLAQVVGVRLPSYASLSLTWRFASRNAQ